MLIASVNLSKDENNFNIMTIETNFLKINEASRSELADNDLIADHLIEKFKAIEYFSKIFPGISSKQLHNKIKRLRDSLILELSTGEQTVGQIELKMEEIMKKAENSEKN